MSTFTHTTKVWLQGERVLVLSAVVWDLWESFHFLGDEYRSRGVIKLDSRRLRFVEKMGMRKKRGAEGMLRNWSVTLISHFCSKSLDYAFLATVQDPERFAVFPRRYDYLFKMRQLKVLLGGLLLSKADNYLCSDLRLTIRTAQIGGSPHGLPNKTHS